MVVGLQNLEYRKHMLVESESVNSGISDFAFIHKTQKVQTLTGCSGLL